MTRTALQNGVWWMLDLGAEYRIESIHVYNRTDCCGEQLNNAIVAVTATEGWPNATVRFDRQLAAQPVNDFHNVGVSGRYIYIANTGQAYLSLAEVAVTGVLAPTAPPPTPPPTPTPPATVCPAPATPPLGDPNNLAFNKRTLQSITANNAESFRAVDGDMQSASVTGPGDIVWWMVDLGDKYQIQTVGISGHGTAGAVHLTATEAWPLRDLRGSQQLSIGRALNFGAAVARYVYIAAQGNLTLMEVQVTGVPYRSALGENLALKKSTAQSSTECGGESSRAVDGNTNGIWASGSVTHTALQQGAWWMVDLNGEQSIDSVVVYSRTDCCGDQLNALVAITTDAGWPNSGPVRVQRSLGQPQPVMIVRAGVLGRYVYIVNTGNAPLTLAEVIVWGRRRN